MARSDRPPMKKAQQISSLLKDILGQPGFGEQINRHQAWLIWDQLVGEQIAARARPLKLRKGTLEVQVDHPVWMQQLQMLKPAILEKINAQIPHAGIEEIYLRQTRQSQAYTPTKKKQVVEPLPWAQIELTSIEKEAIEKEISQINNIDLKNEMRIFFTRQKQLDKERNN